MQKHIYKLVKFLVEKYKNISYRISRKLFILDIRYSNNVQAGKGLILDGIPQFSISSEARLKIGDNVTLTSRNLDYHLNLFAPVRLIADKKNSLISIGDNSRIHGTCIHAWEKVIIGNNCLIAANCNIIDSNGHDISFPDVEDRINSTGKSKAVEICDNVWIGAGTYVLPGVTIGKGSVISANSVVKDDIAEFVIAGGNPAVIIRKMKN